MKKKMKWGERNIYKREKLLVILGKSILKYVWGLTLCLVYLYEIYQTLYFFGDEIFIFLKNYIWIFFKFVTWTSQKTDNEKRRYSWTCSKGNGKELK